MKNKLLRVTFVSTAVGVVFELISEAFTFFLVFILSENAGALSIINHLLAIGLVVLLFFICFKDMSRKEILKSSLLFCGVIVIYVIFISIGNSLSLSDKIADLFVNSPLEVGTMPLGHFISFIIYSILGLPTVIYRLLLPNVLPAHFHQFSYLLLMPVVLLYTITPNRRRT